MLLLLPAAAAVGNANTLHRRRRIEAGADCRCADSPKQKRLWSQQSVRVPRRATSLATRYYAPCLALHLRRNANPT